MAAPALDPNTALPTADLQKGIVGLLHPIGEVVGRACTLTDAFRGLGLPVVARGAPGRTEQRRRHDGPFPADFADFAAELGHGPHDIVTKQTWGAFASGDREAQLKGGSVAQVVIAGGATGTGVEATARQAYEQGVNVTLAIDAITDVRPEARDYRLRKVFPRLGEVCTARKIIDLLSTRSA